MPLLKDLENGFEKRKEKKRKDLFSVMKSSSHFLIKWTYAYTHTQAASRSHNHVTVCKLSSLLHHIKYMLLFSSLVFFSFHVRTPFCCLFISLFWAISLTNIIQIFSEFDAPFYDLSIFLSILNSFLLILRHFHQILWRIGINCRIIHLIGIAHFNTSVSFALFIAAQIAFRLT